METDVSNLLFPHFPPWDGENEFPFQSCADKKLRLFGFDLNPNKNVESSLEIDESVNSSLTTVSTGNEKIPEEKISKRKTEEKKFECGYCAKEFAIPRHWGVTKMLIRRKGWRRRGGCSFKQEKPISTITFSLFKAAVISVSRIPPHCFLINPFTHLISITLRSPGAVLVEAITMEVPVAGGPVFSPWHTLIGWSKNPGSWIFNWVWAWILEVGCSAWFLGRNSAHVKTFLAFC